VQNIKLTDRFEIGQYIFIWTGAESNLGREYQIKKDIGQAYHQMHNRYFKTIEQVYDYLYEEF